MKKLIKILKKGIALILVLILSFNSFSAVVGDNDGSAFITKAEFDSLKNTFQAQIDQYNTSIDSKIDGAIAGYLAGIRISKTELLESLIDSKYKYLEMIGNDNALGWRRIGSNIKFTGVCYASFWRSNQSTSGWSERSREGLITSKWTPKSTPSKKEVYSMTSVNNDSKIYNPQKDKRYVDGDHKVVGWPNNAESRYMTSNWQKPVIAYGSNMYGSKLTSDTSAKWNAARAAAWQEGLSFGQYIENTSFTYKQPNKNRTQGIYSYKLATADNVDPTQINTISLYLARIDNWSTPTGPNTNYMMGMGINDSTYAVVNELKYQVDDTDLTLLGCVGKFDDHILQFYDADASNLYIGNARTNGSISKSAMKYDVKAQMWLYQHQFPWRNTQSESNIMRQDATNSFAETDIVPTTITTYTPTSTTSGGDWPNMLPYDILITDLSFKKSIDKSKVAYYTKDILSKRPSDKLTNYMAYNSWAYGFPLWEVDKNGTLSFKPQFKNNSTTYLLWVLKGPSSSIEPYKTAPSNYYRKADNCKLTQRTSGNGMGAFECKSGDNIIIKDVEKNDVIYLYFTTTDGKSGPILKNNMSAIFESED